VTSVEWPWCYLTSGWETGNESTFRSGAGKPSADARRCARPGVGWSAGPLQRGLGMRWVDDAECLDEFESGVVGTEAEVHPAAEGHNRRSISSRLAATPPAVAATRYHRARCTGWRPLSHGGNASRVVRRGLPCRPAQATAVRGSPTLRRSPTTSTPRNHVRPPRGAGTTGTARSAPGLGGTWYITDPTRRQLLLFSARHTPAHRGSQNTLLAAPHPCASLQARRQAAATSCIAALSPPDAAALSCLRTDLSCATAGSSRSRLLAPLARANAFGSWPPPGFGPYAQSRTIVRCGSSRRRTPCGSGSPHRVASSAVLSGDVRRRVNGRRWATAGVSTGRPRGGSKARGPGDCAGAFVLPKTRPTETRN